MNRVPAPFLSESAIWIILPICVAVHTLGFLQKVLGADPDSSHPPSVFQPGEIQHGFSEFDSLPEIPPDDPPPSSPEISSDAKGPDFHYPDQKPAGLFLKVEFAESFEEEQGIRKGHMIVPINPTNEFSPETRSIYLVFSLFKHHTPYQVFGRLYPERVDHQDPTALLDEDIMYIAAEDESGYLQFFPQTGQWIPGTYQVKIFVGWETNDVNHMGTMRFTITSTPSPLTTSPE